MPDTCHPLSTSTAAASARRWDRIRLYRGLPTASVWPWMMMVDFSILGSVRACATLSSCWRASGVRLAELNAKFMVWSKDPGLIALAVAVMPRTCRVASGMAHCGLSAQTICSTESSSAGAVDAPSAKLRPQSSAYAYFAAPDDFSHARKIILANDRFDFEPAVIGAIRPAILEADQ